MTSDDIKSILDTISTSIELVDENYSKELSDDIRKIATSLTPANIAILAGLFGIDADKMNDNLTKLVKILDGMDKVFLTDQADKIEDFCERLKDRTLVLKFLAWKLS